MILNPTKERSYPMKFTVKTPSDIAYKWGDTLTIDGETVNGIPVDAIDPEESTFDTLAEYLANFGLYLY